MKNRKQIEARRRQKTAARAKRNKAYVSPSPRKVQAAPAADPIEAYKDRWFVAHGLNYLASDYTAGTWTPLFDIYGEDLEFEKIPTTSQAFYAVIAKHYNTETKDWTPEGKLLAAWLMVAPETMRGIRMALLRHMTVEDNVEAAADELVKPHHPRVWEFFHEQIRSRTILPDEVSALAPTTEGETATIEDGGQPVEEAP